MYLADAFNQSDKRENKPTSHRAADIRFIQKAYK